MSKRNRPDKKTHEMLGKGFGASVLIAAASLLGTSLGYSIAAPEPSVTSGDAAADHNALEPDGVDRRMHVAEKEISYTVRGGQCIDVKTGRVVAPANCSPQTPKTRPKSSVN